MYKTTLQIDLNILRIVQFDLLFIMNVGATEVREGPQKKKL